MVITCCASVAFGVIDCQLLAPAGLRVILWSFMVIGNYANVAKQMTINDTEGK